MHAAAESKQLQQLQEFIGLLDSYSVAPRSRKGEVLRLLQEHPAYEPCRHVFIEADRRIKKGGLGQRGMKTAEPEATHHKSLTLPTAKVSVNKKPVIVRKSSIRNAG